MRRAWLQQLDEAAQRALDHLDPLDDPPRELIRDLEAFRERIVAELAADR